MTRKKVFLIRTNGNSYKVSLDEGMKLVQCMDTNPYSMSQQEIQFAESFEMYFLDLKRKNTRRNWGVVQPPNQNK